MCRGRARGSVQLSAQPVGRAAGQPQVLIGPPITPRPRAPAQVSSPGPGKAVTGSTLPSPALGTVAAERAVRPAQLSGPAGQREKRLIHLGSTYAGDCESEEVSSQSARPRRVETHFPLRRHPERGCVPRRLRCRVSVRAPRGKKTSRRHGQTQRQAQGLELGWSTGHTGPRSGAGLGPAGQRETRPGRHSSPRQRSFPREPEVSPSGPSTDWMRPTHDNLLYLKPPTVAVNTPRNTFMDWFLTDNWAPRASQGDTQNGPSHEERIISFKRQVT